MIRRKISRPPRIESVGAVHHVTALGDRREEIFRHDQGRSKLLGYLTEGAERYRVKVHICLLENHFHPVREERNSSTLGADQVLERLTERFQCDVETLKERRDQAAGYIERFLQERGTTVETEYPERAVKIWYRPKDSKTRSLTIIAYWERGFYVWVVWKGEDGEREDVNVGIGNDPVQRKEFPELDHLLVGL